MLTFIVTITGRYICSTNRYYDKNENKWGGLYVVLAVIVTIMTITWRSIGCVISYWDNNGEI